MAIAGELTREDVIRETSKPRASRKKPVQKTNGNRRIIKTSSGVTITLSHRRRLTDQDVTNALREALNLSDRNQQGVA